MLSGLFISIISFSWSRELVQIVVFCFHVHRFCCCCWCWTHDQIETDSKPIWFTYQFPTWIHILDQSVFIFFLVYQTPALSQSSLKISIWKKQMNKIASWHSIWLIAHLTYVFDAFFFQLFRKKEKMKNILKLLVLTWR